MISNYICDIKMADEIKMLLHFSQGHLNKEFIVKYFPFGILLFNGG